VADLEILKNEYESFLNEFGQNKSTAHIQFDLATLEAFFLNNLDQAIALLEELKAIPGLNKYLKANSKLQLGDFYLMKGEQWESTLLYSQVDKEFKDDLLGQRARFKNAKLSYFTGDFQWAQTQFDVLKASTSKLIANDALDLSVFIMDNLGLDTISDPLEIFANAELLVFQNRFEEAVDAWDQVEKLFPDHALEDDIYFSKAEMFEKRRQYALAAEMYQKVFDLFPDEIRADNSLFALARLYENQLADPEKAKELYEKLFIDFSNSTLAVEARKRYRILRGDFEETDANTPEQ
jgi:tetratricopeptide (TPR) repeat protein